MARFVCLSLLAGFTPLYGKRAASSSYSTRNKKQNSELFSAADAEAVRAGVAESIKTARRCGDSEVKAQSRHNMDLGKAFPFVPQLFLAVLMSAYSTHALQAVLSLERVQTLEIWADFSDDLRSVLEEGHPSGEQDICNQYLRRFANVCASMDNVAMKTEEARVEELRCQGKQFGSAQGDGNCLISSLLQGLVQAGLLQQSLVHNQLRFLAEVRSCRAALVALPVGDPLRPVKRDPTTNCISAATDEQHANAYLQFHLHAVWIVEYYLRKHGSQVPAGGLLLKCYSRFDDVLGGEEMLSLPVDDNTVVSDDPCEIGVYNWTGACLFFRRASLGFISCS